MWHSSRTHNIYQHGRIGIRAVSLNKTMPTIVSLLIEIVCSVPIVADNKGGSSELDQDLYIKEPPGDRDIYSFCQNLAFYVQNSLDLNHTSRSFPGLQSYALTTELVRNQM